MEEEEKRVLEKESRFVSVRNNFIFCLILPRNHNNFGCHRRNVVVCLYLINSCWLLRFFFFFFYWKASLLPILNLFRTIGEFYKDIFFLLPQILKVKLIRSTCLSGTTNSLNGRVREFKMADGKYFLKLNELVNFICE